MNSDYVKNFLKNNYKLILISISILIIIYLIIAYFLNLWPIMEIIGKPEHFDGTSYLIYVPNKKSTILAYHESADANAATVKPKLVTMSNLTYKGIFFSITTLKNPSSCGNKLGTAVSINYNGGTDTSTYHLYYDSQDNGGAGSVYFKSGAADSGDPNSYFKLLETGGIFNNRKKYYISTYDCKKYLNWNIQGTTTSIPATLSSKPDTEVQFLNVNIKTTTS